MIHLALFLLPLLVTMYAFFPRTRILHTFSQTKRRRRHRIHRRSPHFCSVLLLLALLDFTLAKTQVHVQDCRAPRDITDVATPSNEPDPCINDVDAEVEETHATFVLLVREHMEKIQGYKCTVKDTRTVSYCGFSDHQTLFAKYNYVEMIQPVSVRACEQMVNKGHYYDPSGGLHSVEIDQINHLYYQSVGRTFPSGGGTEIECEGGEFKVGGQVYKGMVVEHNLAVTIERQEIRYSQGDLRAVDGLHLPCGVEERGCETPQATLIWPKKETRCELATSKAVAGMIAINKKSGDKVFMSTDGNLVRLVLGSTVAMCRQIVYSTNYDNLFLYKIPADRTNPFTRQAQPESVSITTYVNNRDDYLYHHLLNQISEEMGSVLSENCHRHHQERKSKFFLKHQNAGLANYHAGGNTFATAAGEVLYYYQCHQRVAEPISLTRCYDALPIRFSDEDIANASANMPLSGTFFIEPLTHRLTTVATEIPCSTQFPAKYETTERMWIKAAPAIHDTPRPDTPPEFLHRLPKFDTEADFSKGGPFTQEAMTQMERLFEMPRRVDAIGSALADQTRFDTLNPIVTPRDLFDHDPTDWFTGPLQKFLRFLEIWGEAAAICTSMYVLCRMMASLLELLWGGRNVHKMEGCGLGLLAFICCPSAYLTKKMRYEPTRVNDTLSHAPMGHDPTKDQAYADREAEISRREAALETRTQALASAQASLLQTRH